MCAIPGKSWAQGDLLNPILYECVQFLARPEHEGPAEAHPSECVQFLSSGSALCVLQSSRAVSTPTLTLQICPQLSSLHSNWPAWQRCGCDQCCVAVQGLRVVAMEVSLASLLCLCPSPTGATLWDTLPSYISGFSLSLFYTPVVVVVWLISPAIQRSHRAPLGGI